ncbi:MAG TPA: hypothetical protein VIT64_01775 [Ilumatobacteraceae bacterium]
MNTPTIINHPTSTSTDAAQILDAIGDIVDAALVEIEGALLVSQSRCVDLLLDLYIAAPIGTTRHVIEARLSDIRHLNAVEADEVRADLYAVLAIAAAESAIEAALLAHDLADLPTAAVADPSTDLSADLPAAA